MKVLISYFSAEVLAAPILTPTTASLSTAFTSNPHIMPSSMPLYPWCSRLQRRYHPAVFPHPAATSVAPAAHKCQPSATNATRPCHISDRLPPSSRRMMEFMADIHEAAGGDDSVKAIEVRYARHEFNTYLTYRSFGSRTPASHLCITRPPFRITRGHTSSGRSSSRLTCVNS